MNKIRQQIDFDYNGYTDIEDPDLDLGLFDSYDEVDPDDYEEGFDEEDAE